MLKPKAKIDKKLLDACTHCGLCLPACPTYLATGREMESPRGRIYLLNLWQSGNQNYSKRLAQHIDSCLGCLGCQSACPSGVQYASLLDQVRPQLAKTRPWFLRAPMRFVFQAILPKYSLLEKFGRLLRSWQLNDGRGFLGRLGQRFRFAWLKDLISWESYLPQVPKFVPLPSQSWRASQKLGTVQFFAGCVMNIFYNHVNHAAIRLLHTQGQVVEVPPQTCCGALAFHAGEQDIAKELAKQNIQYFENRQGEIVVTSAGCGAMLKDYGELFGSNDPWYERAKSFVSRVKDLTEFLNSHQFAATTLGKAQAPASSIAYHAACHLAHAQGIREAPKKLLEDMVSSIKTAHNGESDEPKVVPELVPLIDAEHCCGSAGIYNLFHLDLSEQVLASKMRNIVASGAQVVVTTNPGCLLQLEAGARKSGLNVRIAHIAEILGEAYLSRDNL